jgi:hypothetical protein
MRLARKVFAFDSDIYIHPRMYLKTPGKIKRFFGIAWDKALKNISTSGEGGGSRGAVVEGAVLQIFEETGYLNPHSPIAADDMFTVSAASKTTVGFFSKTMSRVTSSYVHINENVDTSLSNWGKTYSHNISRYGGQVTKTLAKLFYLDRITPKSVFNVEKLVHFLYASGLINDEVVEKSKANLHIHTTNAETVKPAHFEYKKLIKEDKKSGIEKRKAVLQATASVPVLVKELAIIDDQEHIDGGIFDCRAHGLALQKIKKYVLLKKIIYFKKFQRLIRCKRRKKIENMIFISSKPLAYRSEQFKGVVHNVIDREFKSHPKLNRAIRIHHNNRYNHFAHFLEKMVKRSTPRTTVIAPGLNFKVERDTTDINELMIGHFQMRRVALSYLNQIGWPLNESYQYELTYDISIIYSLWARSMSKNRMKEILSGYKMSEILNQMMIWYENKSGINTDEYEKNWNSSLRPATI